MLVFLTLNMIQIKHVKQEGADLELIKQLFREYALELNENLCFQSFDEEVATPLIKYGWPHGSLYIAYLEEQPAGCIALCKLGEAICEMKRLYVRPGFRKQGIGEKLVEVLLQDAIAKGYKTMMLDTLEKLQPAIRLYEQFGFKNTSAYYPNPLPNVVYMEKALSA